MRRRQHTSPPPHRTSPTASSASPPRPRGTNPLASLATRGIGSSSPKTNAKGASGGESAGSAGGGCSTNDGGSPSSSPASALDSSARRRLFGFAGGLLSSTPRRAKGGSPALQTTSASPDASPDASSEALPDASRGALPGDSPILVAVVGAEERPAVPADDDAAAEAKSASSEEEEVAQVPGEAQHETLRRSSDEAAAKHPPTVVLTISDAAGSPHPASSTIAPSRAPANCGEAEGAVSSSAAPRPPAAPSIPPTPPSPFVTLTTAAAAAATPPTVASVAAEAEPAVPPSPLAKAMETASIELAARELIAHGKMDGAVAAAAMRRLGAQSTDNSSPRPRFRGREVALSCLEALGGGKAGVGSFRLIVRVMRAHRAKNPEEMDAAVREMMRNPGAAASLVGADATEEAASLGVQTAGCVLIRRMCAGGEARRAEAAEAGAIGAVISGMRAHPDDALLQASGCRALLELTRKADEALDGEQEDDEGDGSAAGDEGRCMRAAEEGALDVLASILFTYGPREPTATSAVNNGMDGGGSKAMVAIAAMKDAAAAGASPANGGGDRPERARGRRAMRHAVMCVLVLTFGSVIRAHWAVQAGIVTALNTTARRSRLPGVTPLPFLDQIDLARQWLEMQSRLLGPRAKALDRVPRKPADDGSSDSDASELLRRCLPGWLGDLAAKCVGGLEKSFADDLL